MYGALGNLTSIGDQSTERHSILLGNQIMRVYATPIICIICAHILKGLRVWILPMLWKNELKLSVIVSSNNMYPKCHFLGLHPDSLNKPYWLNILHVAILIQQ